ncbi:nitrogen fixation protein NifX [Blastopirellula marina]|uniref:Nitrogen fixation protein NifX n=1 Tax=Blastopirellula marina TaxID=124 RepID=A0A2S8GNE6_9BACT|nr:nitrogen fixation protein NifX [Blastopirellula marina]PQO45948.1 nitrogen fixation protein NifX [Blastopirellula marina]
MTTETVLSRDVALRVALAARALKQIDARELVDLLLDMVDAPLTKEKLATITVTGLKNTIAGGVDQDAPESDYNATSATRTLPSLESLKEAVRVLWGLGEDEEESLPTPAAESLPAAIRVAIATSDGGKVDEHFGGCHRFYVYEVNKDEFRLADYRTADDTADDDDPSAARADLIKDCHVLYVAAIGGPAAAKVINRKIYPMKVEDQPDVEATLRQLQQKMINNPPPWLAKILDVPAELRTKFGSASDE